MRCFESLVKSHFLANVSAELRLARQTIQMMSQSYSAPSLFFKKKEKKSVYDRIVYENFLLEELKDSIQGFEDVDVIFYLQVEHFIFIYSPNYRQIKEALRYSYNLNGDIPLCQSKHIVDGKAIYTILIDSRIQFKTISPN